MSDPKGRPGSQDLEDRARQQTQLWMVEGDHACAKRQFIKGLRYYQQALEIAEKHRLRDLQARLCRDLAYIYVHHGAADKALQVLAAAPQECKPEIHIGLLVNRATALLSQHDFRESLNSVRQALGSLDEHYPKLEGAPPALLGTYCALTKMVRDLERVVDLMDSGVNPDRIQVTVELARPYWMPTGAR
jgi:tetratricopeptide (TPR) repeat protein